MNKYRFLITIFVVLLLFQSLSAEKRANPMPMDELTNPKSPSYVPYPYPKTREEIIADIKYAIKKTCTPQQGKYNSFLSGHRPVTLEIKLNLLEDQPKYKFGKIIKVKNRQSGYSMDYYWMIYILNKEDNSIAARIQLLAEGLYVGTAAYFPDEKPHYVKNDREIIDMLDEYSKTIGDTANIKHMSRIFFPSPISSPFGPFWEIKMNNGKIYYYSLGDNTVFQVKEKLDWKKDKKGHRPNWKNLVTNLNFAFDEIDDKIIVLEKVKK